MHAAQPASTTATPETITKVDVLAIVSHPDDAELGCGGTLLKLAATGKKTGIVDLSRGELGTRGSAELRTREAARASELLGLTVRENLDYADGFFQNDPEHQRGIIHMIRRFQPEIILTNAPRDRHPDHGRAAELVRAAAFYSGLIRIEDGLPAWRPKHVFHIIQSYNLEPTFVVDITEFYPRKLEAIQAYGSQFYNPNSKAPESYIATERFWHFLEARDRSMGQFIGVNFGEGFIADQPLRIGTPLDLI